VAAIAPVGFFMGMPFPTGLGLLEHVAASAVRWAWALNAASSVLGSVGAIFCALYLGLRATLLIGACLYLGAMFFAALQTRSVPVPNRATAPVAT
jgi:hypothetical protein